MPRRSMKATMPKMLYGTAWKKDRTAELVVEALKAGFRGIDTANYPLNYNEKGVGNAIKLAMKDKEEGGLGIKRKSLFIQTKFVGAPMQDRRSMPFDLNYSPDVQVHQSFENSLENLGVSYVDSLILHSPLCHHIEDMFVWVAFEQLVEEGKVKQLGLSNFYSLPELKQFYQEVGIKPQFLQNRFHAGSNFDKEIRQFCKEKQIIYQAFGTLVDNPQILGHSTVTDLAKARDKTPAQLFFAFLMSSGIVPLAGCKSLDHMVEDVEAMSLILTPEEMQIFQQLID